MSMGDGQHEGRLARTGSRAWSRVTSDAWPLLQGTAAATIAWVIAKHVLSHHQPFFAPIAAVVALNTSRGERGIQAVRLVQGVVVGIVVGELTLAALGAGYGPLALATFIAMAVARALGGARIVLAQAAIGAILVSRAATSRSGHSGWSMRWSASAGRSRRSRSEPAATCPARRSRATQR